MWSRILRSIRLRRATSCPRASTLATRRAKAAAKPATVAPKDVIKTALCVEVRNGHLHVFMPPLVRLEDYVDLLASIEATAAQGGNLS